MVTTNLLLCKILYDGYRYNGQVINNDYLKYCIVQVEEGKQYICFNIRMIDGEDTNIVNMPVDGTILTFDFSGKIYITFNPNSNAEFAEYNENYVYNPGRGFANPILKNEDNFILKTDKLSIDDLKEIQIKDGTSILPLVSNTINGCYYYLNNNIIIKQSNDDYTTVILKNIKPGSIYTTVNIRFALLVDENNICLRFDNNNGGMNNFITVIENTSLLYISYNNTNYSNFDACYSNVIVSSIPNSVKYITGIQFDNLEDIQTKINYIFDDNYKLLNICNKPDTAVIENACTYGEVTYTTGSYVLYDTFSFSALAGVKYNFYPSARFLSVNSTAIGMYQHSYTPEEDCILVVCIDNTDRSVIKIYTDDTNIVDVEPYQKQKSIIALNTDFCAQEMGNAANKTMSQKAITNAINSLSGGNLNDKLYAKGHKILQSDIMSSGDTLKMPMMNIKKNQIFSFMAKINLFGSLYIGHGKTNYSSTYFEITNTEVIKHTYYTSDSVQKFTHNLNIANYIYVQIINKITTTDFIIYSNGQVFKQENMTGCVFDSASQSFVELIEGSLYDCEFSWGSGDFRKPIWAFGDSYFSFTSEGRWPYYLGDFVENVLLNAYPGENTGNSLIALNNMINDFGKPNTICWCLGMNDGSDANENTPTTAWLNGYNQVKQICDENNIELILATIPNVPNISHLGKNKIVRESGYRYIDFDKAVGANASSSWIAGMLSSDNIHPSATGARALYHAALLSVPEISYNSL